MVTMPTKADPREYCAIFGHKRVKTATGDFCATCGEDLAPEEKR